MGRQIPGSSPVADAEQTELGKRGRGRLRCSICARRLGDTVTYLEETGDVPEPRQSWVLCQDCNTAVKAQMARAPVNSPLRLRVAVGMVSTERSPAARAARRGQLTDSGWLKLLLVAFLGGFLVHLIIIVIIAGLAH